MKVSSKWMRWVMVVAALAAIVGIAAVTVPGVAQAAANLAGPWGAGMRGVDTNHDQALADALGITVDELDAAQVKARDAALDQAVADGKLTQEEADLMKARWAFDAFVAEKMKTAYDEAVAAAVDEGIVTQAQADTFTAGGGFPGREFRGRGNMGWDMPDGATPGQMPGGMHMRPGGGSR